MSYSSPVSHPTNGAGGSVFQRLLFSRVNTPRQHWLASGLLASCYIVVSVEVAEALIPDGDGLPIFPADTPRATLRAAAILLGGERFNVL